LGTINPGLPFSTTDKLPDLFIDSSHQMAYAVNPEFGVIAVVDPPVTTFLVEGYQGGDSGGGSAQLQIAVNQSRKLVFSFWSKERRLSIDAADDGYAQIDFVDLSELNWRNVPLINSVLSFLMIRKTAYLLALSN
jgi:hypothetical protein